MRENAASLIVIHNHPSGDPSPSSEDIRVTRQLVAANATNASELLDEVSSLMMKLKEGWDGLPEALDGADNPEAAARLHPRKGAE